MGQYQEASNVGRLLLVLRQKKGKEAMHELMRMLGIVEPKFAKTLEGFGAEDVESVDNTWCFVCRGHRFVMSWIPDDTGIRCVWDVIPESSPSYPDVFVPLRDHIDEEMYTFHAVPRIEFTLRERWKTQRHAPYWPKTGDGVFDEKVRMDSFEDEEFLHDVVGIRDVRVGVFSLLESGSDSVEVCMQDAALRLTMHVKDLDAWRHLSSRDILDTCISIVRALPPFHIEQNAIQSRNRRARIETKRQNTFFRDWVGWTYEQGMHVLRDVGCRGIVFPKTYVCQFVLREHMCVLGRRFNSNESPEAFCEVIPYDNTNYPTTFVAQGTQSMRDMVFVSELPFIRLKKETFFHHLSKIMGFSSEIQVGCEGFDRKVYIEANPKDTFRTRLMERKGVQESVVKALEGPWDIVDVFGRKAPVVGRVLSPNEKDWQCVFSGEALIPLIELALSLPLVRVLEE